MMINPLITNSTIDSCAFDPKYEPESSASLEIFDLFEQNGKMLLIAHSTEKEINHPRTPLWVKQKALSMIFTVNVSLTEEEITFLHKIERILAGKGNVENIYKDARHIFEAQKYGSYFITTDVGILKHAEILHSQVGITVIKPSKFLTMIKQVRQIGTVPNLI